MSEWFDALRPVASRSRSARAVRPHGRRCALTCGVFALVWLGLGASLPAQTGLTGGAIQGTVRDDTDRVLAGVPVTLVGDSTGITRIVTTDADGRYSLAALPLGTYRVRVEPPGFLPLVREDLVLAVGQVLVFDVRMSLARYETVSVESHDARGGNEGAAVAARVGPAAIEGLPANGRDFVGLSLLTPGVVAERTPPTGPTTSSGLSFAGQRARSNHVMVDGFDNDDAWSGGVAASFSQEAVREFQVLAGSAPAEFGHASGGTVNIVTKSGTNDWRDRTMLFRDLAGRSRADQLSGRGESPRWSPAGLVASERRVRGRGERPNPS